MAMSTMPAGTVRPQIALTSAALDYTSRGLALIPCDSTKKPIGKVLPNASWAPFKDRVPTETEVNTWFEQALVEALAGIHGAISGNRESIDFDAPELYPLWADLAEQLAPGVVERCTLTQTPSGGYHITYRCTEAVEGNKKLAKDEQQITLIETRGEGGYCILAPSPGYTLLRGSVAEPVEITPAERAMLLDAARAFNMLPQQDTQTAAAPLSTSLVRPGDDYNARGDIAPLLTGAGWKQVYSRGDASYWRRPGKTEGISASLNHIPGAFYVFSSNAAPFEPERKYSPFSVYGLLEHGGDYKLAAAQLGREGYGTVQTGGSLERIAPPSTAQTSIGRLIRADDLHTLPPTRWLVEGVIGTNKLHQLFAPGGSGKSFIALDMALCVAQYAAVVYIAGEAIEDYHPRVEAWKQHHQKSASNLTFWNGPVDLGTPSAVQTFITAVQPLGPALIVLDPLASCFVGLEESSTGDMTRAIDALNTIRTATGAAVFVIHHTGWGPEHERGSSALRAACRMVMKLTNTDGLLKLTCEKTNSTQGFEPRYFRLFCRNGSSTPVPVPSSSVLDTSTKLSIKQIEVLDTLSLQQFLDTGASHSSIVDHTGMSKSTANQAISKLLKQKLISANDGRFKVFKITPRGEEAVKNADEQTTEAQQVEAAQGVNWQVNTSALEVHTPYELDMNYGMNYGELEPTGEGASSLEVHSPQAQVHTSSYQVHTPYEPKFISSYLPPSLEGEGVNYSSEQHHMDSPKADNVLELPERKQLALADEQPPAAQDLQRAARLRAWIDKAEYRFARGVLSTITHSGLYAECLAEIEAEDVTVV